jgi:hypothetical protein
MIGHDLLTNNVGYGRFGFAPSRARLPGRDTTESGMRSTDQIYSHQAVSSRDRGFVPDKYQPIPYPFRA